LPKGSTVFQLSNANLSSPVFVKNLKPANKVFGLSRGAKPIGPVQDAEEKIKVNCQSETVTRKQRARRMKRH
jgi:hypothetical protein